MRLLTFWLLLAAPTLAAPDARKVYRAEMKQLRRAGTKFWDAFPKRQTQAYNRFMVPYWDMVRAMNQGRGTTHNLVWDSSLYRRLYEDYAAIEEARGQAALSLARSGHAKAMRTLFTALLDLADEIDATETELAKRKPGGLWAWFDQRRGVLRHGLAFRSRRLVEALAGVPGGAAFLADVGLTEAAKRDRGRSIVRRVAVIDALGRSGDPAARPVLEAMLGAKPTYQRIAALEALIRFGAATTSALRSVLRDPSPVVRRALLAAIRTQQKENSRWIAAVLQAYETAKGLVRADCVATLVALTRQRFGDDPERWQAWYEKHRAAIDAGTFDASELEVQKVGTRPPKRAVAFYGIPTSSDTVVFVLDGSENLLVPADHEIQRQRAYWDWVFTGKWQQRHPTHHAILLQQLEKTLGSLPGEASFGVVMVKESGAVKTLGSDKGLVRATDTQRRKALRFVASHAPRGWRSELANLVTAMELAGLHPHGIPDCRAPRADTVFMLCDGSVRGGRFMLPEAALAAFERLNRFRRLVVHTVRICNAGKESETFLSGLAESSGGTYRWSKKPPP